MWCVRVMCLTVSALASLGCAGSMFQSEGLSAGSTRATTTAAVKLAGRVPLARVLRELERLELLSHHPASVPEVEVWIEGESTAQAVIERVEVETGWVYGAANKAFAVRLATHRVESPDPAGRAGGGLPVGDDWRPAVTMTLRFARAGADFSKVALGGQVAWVDQSYSVTPGVVAAVQNQEEREYELGVRDARGGPTIATDRGSVTAGMSFDGLIGLLPKGGTRLDLQISITSFVGAGTRRVGVSFPLQLDCPRGQFIKVYSHTTADAQARLVFEKMGLTFGAGVNQVAVWVKVD